MSVVRILLNWIIQFLGYCVNVCRRCWTHCRRSSTASSTEVSDFATSVSFYATLTATVIMIIHFPGLLKVVRRHLQEWMRTNRHRYCIHSTNRCACHDWMSGLSWCHVTQSINTSLYNTYYYTSFTHRHHTYVNSNVLLMIYIWYGLPIFYLV